MGALKNYISIVGVPNYKYSMIHLQTLCILAVKAPMIITHDSGLLLSAACSILNNKVHTPALAQVSGSA